MAVSKDQLPSVKDGRGREISSARKLRLFRLAELICSGQYTQSECLEQAGYDPNNRHLLQSPAYLHVERIVSMSYHMDTAQHRKEIVGLALEIAWDKENESTKDRLKSLEMLARWSGLENQVQPPSPSDTPPKRHQSDAVREVLAEIMPDDLPTP
jgi:hypothetical protein